MKLPTKKLSNMFINIIFLVNYPFYYRIVILGLKIAVTIIN